MGFHDRLAIFVPTGRIAIPPLRHSLSMLIRARSRELFTPLTARVVSFGDNTELHLWRDSGELKAHR